jgi:glycosyltransferase involved in cell wall biosynthesis
VAIHLLNPLWDATGGSERRTLQLFTEFAEHAEVALWTEYTPDPALLGGHPIRQMLATKTFPRSGTFVFVGAYWEIGAWMRHASPDRVILVYNVMDPEMLEHRIAQLESYGVKKVEIRYASTLIAQHANGRPGTVEFSPIDFDQFSPAPRTPNGKVTIGRHSRDQAFKHHPNDANIYRGLVEAGCDVRILGGSCLRSTCDSPGIDLLPAGSVPAEQFLRTLDIFFYQTDPSWTEVYGRVVAEAMGCGLPCVAGAGGGYEALIETGENGFIFSSQNEAIEILERLVADPELRARIGSNARESIVALYDIERRKTIDYYVGV